MMEMYNKYIIEPHAESCRIVYRSIPYENISGLYWQSHCECNYSSKTIRMFFGVKHHTNWQKKRSCSAPPSLSRMTFTKQLTSHMLILTTLSCCPELLLFIVNFSSGVVGLVCCRGTIGVGWAPSYSRAMTHYVSLPVLNLSLAQIRRSRPFMTMQKKWAMSNLIPVPNLSDTTIAHGCPFMTMQNQCPDIVLLLLY